MQREVHLRANETHLLVKERAMKMLRSKTKEVSIARRPEKSGKNSMGDTAESSHKFCGICELVRLSRTAAWPRGLHTLSLRQAVGFTTLFTALLIFCKAINSAPRTRYVGIAISYFAIQTNIPRGDGGRNPFLLFVARRALCGGMKIRIAVL
jgi:hypothetical protein